MMNPSNAATTVYRYSVAQSSVSGFWFWEVYDETPDPDYPGEPLHLEAAAYGHAANRSCARAQAETAILRLQDAEAQS